MAAPASSAVNYAGLKAWIAQQEAYEAANSKPAPLTPAQYQAVAVLLEPVNPGPMVSEPDVGGTDWVSLLHRYRDARPQGATVTLTFLESGVPNRWSCEVVVEESSPSRGTKVTATFPLRKGTVFARKKDAKQYAAKECATSLMAAKCMPDDGISVTFPKGFQRPTLPARKKLKVNDDVGVDTAHSSGARFLATPPAKRATRGGTKIPKETTIDLEDEGIPATRRVLAICEALGISHPKYELGLQTMDAEDEHGPAVSNSKTLWNGYADMGNFHFLLPDDVGRVTGIMGKNCAKEAVAESLLEWLLEYKKQHEKKTDAQLKAILESPTEIH